MRRGYYDYQFRDRPIMTPAKLQAEWLELQANMAREAQPTPALEDDGTMALNAFDPTGNTIAVVATTSSSATALTDTGVGAADRDYRIYNSGSATVYIAFGAAGITVAAPAAGVPANGIPIPGGTIEVLHSSYTDTYIGMLSSSGSQTVFVTSGSGL